MKSCSSSYKKFLHLSLYLSLYQSTASNQTTKWPLIRCLSRVKMPTHTSTHKHYLAQQAPLLPVCNEKIRPGTTGFLLTRAKDSSVCRNTAEALMRCCPKRRVDISHWLTGLEEAQKQQVVSNIRLNKDSVHCTHPQTAGSPHWRTLLTFFIWLGSYLAESNSESNNRNVIFIQLIMFLKHTQTWSKHKNHIENTKISNEKSNLVRQLSQLLKPLSPPHSSVRLICLSLWLFSPDIF